MILQRLLAELTITKSVNRLTVNAGPCGNNSLPLLGNLHASFGLVTSPHNSTLRATHGPSAWMLCFDLVSYRPRETPYLFLRCCWQSLLSTVRGPVLEPQAPSLSTMFFQVSRDKIAGSRLMLPEAQTIRSVLWEREASQWESGTEVSEEEARKGRKRDPYQGCPQEPNCWAQYSLLNIKRL